MKTKELITTISLIGVISCTSVQKKDVFSYIENLPFRQSERLTDVKPGYPPESIATLYDMDKNGKADMIAFFKIKDLYKDGKANIYDEAYMLGIDYNEDGRLDDILIDDDNNGVLNKRLELSKAFKPKYKDLDTIKGI